MGSLSGLFNLSRSALAADQSALNATANNVANQNTVGYTRQVVSWQAGDSVRLSSVGEVASTGPSTTTKSVRDRILEQRVQLQTQTQSATSARADTLAQMEGVFSLTGSAASPGATAIGTALNSFFSSLSGLAANPSDAATRQGVLSAASTLATTFNSAANQLAAISTGINQTVQSSVAAINGLTATIARLNKAIGSASPGGDAGALEDQRQVAIAQLSQYVGLDQVTTEGNGITLTTQGGAVLVSAGAAFTLTASTSARSTRIADSTGADVTAGVQGGSVGGLLTAQSVDLPSATSALDALAYRVATAVNAQNQAGINYTGNAGGPIFSVPTTASGAAFGLSVVASSPSDVAAASPGEGPGGNTNGNALADLAQGLDSSGQTIFGQLGALLSGVGTSSSALQEQNATEQASLTQLETQRDSLSVVSLNEEAANLALYQKSYEAAAKLLTVLDSLMASAINLGSATTVA